MVRRCLLLLAAVVAFIAPAHANFHLMKVVEVFAGSPAAPNAQYVVIQMYVSDQGALGGHKLFVYDAAGALAGTFTFGTNVTNPQANQTKVFIATTQAQALFNLTPDLVMSPAVLAAGGKVCFEAIDCVAWGNYSGTSTGVGTPAVAIDAARVLKRRLDISGGATTLDGADDTDNSANDFLLAMPAPRNSNDINGTTPASTCGNGVVEGLEQCDDHNTSNGDSCSSTCEVTVPATMISVADAAIAEGNSGTKLLTFTVSLSQASAAAVTYTIATSNGTATAGSDYVARTLVGETIPAGMTSRTFDVTLNGDTAVEPGESFTVTLSAVVGAAIADPQATGLIQNDDAVSLSIAVASITEGNSGTKLLTFTVSLSQASEASVVYDIATANGTASAGSDYVARSLISEEIPAGMTSKTFDVTIIGDTLVEPVETVLVNLTMRVGGVIGDGQATGLIQNDDTATLSIGDAAISEGNSGSVDLVFTLTLDKASASPVTYNLQTSDGTATGSSGDYFPLGQGGQSIPAGATSKTVAIQVFGDAGIEPNETFNVTLSAVGGAVLGDGQAVGVIVNDDGPVLSIADVALGEGNAGTTVANFTVKLSQAAGSNVGFTIATSNAGAVAPTDFVAKTLTAQSIPAGQTTYAFAVTVNGDTTVEPNEKLVVGLSAVTGPATVADGTALGTILNDDGPTLSISDGAVVEGNAGTQSMNFTVTMSQFVGFPVSYTVSTANGSAVAGSDFVGKSIVDTIPAGATSKVFSVVTNGDLAVEPNEVLFVNLTNTQGASAWDGQGFGTVVNDDGPVLTIADLALVEGNSGTRSLPFVVKLSQPAPAPVTYSITTVDGTATVANADYVGRSLVGETIPTGGLSRAFTVTSNGDTAVEANETMLARITAATGASIFDGTGIATLTNDDGPTLVVSDVAVTEGNSGTTTATFTVSLTQPAAVPVTYNIATSNGTAVAGSDYVAKGAVGESIPAGQLSRPFTVTVNGDTAVEAGETFNVVLAQANGATIRDGQGVGTIGNDD
jgi:chitinase